MMKNKKTLGINSNTHLDGLLECEFNLVKPKIKIIDGQIITNFDYQLNIDGYTNTNTNILGVKQIGCNRYPKPIQSLILNELDIITPNIYYNFDEMNDASVQVLINNIPPDIDLLLKANNGARGLGQVIVNRENVHDLLQISYSSKDRNNIISEIENDYVIGGNENDDENRNGYLIETLQNGGYHLCEIINVKEEIRVIGFWGLEPILIKRFVNNYSFQSNASITKKGEHIISHPRYEEIVNISNKLLTYLNTPWLAMDFYIDNNNNIGIFEFQMQMGYRKVPKQLLVNSINKAVKNIINYHEK